MLARKRFNSAHQPSAGLTLVEIAIVILIIAGLLVAILGAREIIRTTRLKKIGAEVQSFGVAARSFEQKYDALPGDFDSASDVIPGCEPGNTNFCSDGDGDGIIGGYCHFLYTNGAGQGSDCGQTGSTRAPHIPAAVALETTMFWKHMVLSGFITGIVDAAANPANPRWQETHPESAVWNAGYVVSSQGGFIGGAVNINFVPTPDFIGSPASISAAGNNRRALTVVDGIYMDTKFDSAYVIDAQGKSGTSETTTLGSGSGAIWWNPSGGDPTDCRTNDVRGVNDAWVTRNLDMKNCTFKWSVF